MQITSSVACEPFCQSMSSFEACVCMCVSDLCKETHRRTKFKTNDIY